MAFVLKSANVYLRSGKYFIHPLASSNKGDLPSLFSEPVTTLVQADTDVLTLGNAVLTAIQQARDDVPWPRRDEWKTRIMPLLATAGVKTEAAFMRGALSTRVDLDGAELTLTYATSKLPKEPGSQPSELKIRAPNAVVLGEAVKRVLGVGD